MRRMLMALVGCLLLACGAEDAATASVHSYARKAVQCTKKDAVDPNFCNQVLGGYVVASYCDVKSGTCIATQCTDDRVVSGGICVCPHETCTDPSSGTEYCRDPSALDPNNCGGCGITCSLDEGCMYDSRCPGSGYACCPYDPLTDQLSCASTCS